VERLLGEAGLAGVILGAQHNFAWITGGGTNRIAAAAKPGRGRSSSAAAAAATSWPT